jgi:UDP-N-acetyl-2-amino-2-deoxyglucuronate dehydrogenase
MIRRKLKLAIIGCGRISQRHIQAALANIDKIELTNVCDVVLERAELRALQYRKGTQHPNQVKVYTNYMDMLDNEDLDVISICTESGYHAEQAVYCMNKGKHVLVEKPMALSTDDADAMIAAATANSVNLCVSHQNRFNPSVQRLRKAIDDNRFGKIISGNARILWNRGPDYYKQAPWRGTYELDGGCLMNQCIHNIDLIQWMLGGQISWVNGDVINSMHPYIEAEDYGSIQIKFENGAVGNVEGTTCVYPTNYEETLTIIGEKGFVALGGLAVNKIEAWRFQDHLEIEENVIAENNNEVDSVYGDGHILLYQDAIEAIENGRQPYINGVSGKKAVEIILAAYKSSVEDNRIQFPISNIASKDFIRR